MTDCSMFPLPKEHWLPHQGVKQCMSCSSTFPKTLFGSTKDNCRKCGRVVCKSCLKYKIEDVRVCTECNHPPTKVIHHNHPPPTKALPIPTEDLYAEYEQRRHNPYLSDDSLKTYQEQFNLNLPSAPMHSDRTRSHSAASTVCVPHSLLDLTTNVSMPSNNAPSSSIPSPFYLKQLTEEKEKAPIQAPKRKSFRSRAQKIDLAQAHQGTRKQSASVGSISHSRKSINTIAWIEDEDMFEIDENAMKSFEDKTYTRSKIKCTEPMIIRLDGFGFGMVTAKMNKPFDKRLHGALVMTACDLLKEFDAYTVFVQSDEIILMYPTTHHKMKAVYLFGGKVAKILSIVASFASVRFIHHLQKEVFTENPALLKQIRNCFASFNGKCFNVSDNSDMFDYVLWRLKANIRGYHKKILTEDVEFCHGTFVKKEKYVTMSNTKKKERERITSCCVQIESKDIQYLKLLVDKYWNEELLQVQTQHTLKPKKDKNNKLSFDDEDVFPDIYNTVLIHEGDTLRRKVPSLTPKRKSMPVKTDVYSIARQFSALSKKGQKIEKKEAIEIKPEVNIYDEKRTHAYDTVIIHDIDTTTNTAQISKPKAKAKMFFKPKKKAYHRPPSMGKVGYKAKSKSPQPPQPSKPLPQLKPSKSSQPQAISPSARQIIKPARANPNYQYNYNISVEVKQDESPKAMSAKERIRYMNQRLQKMKQ